MQDDVLREFLEESWEILSQLETEAVSLEKDPGDSNLLGSISRKVHTINRACGFIGLTGLGRVAHSAEKVLEKMRDGAVAVSPGPVSLVLECIEEIKALLEGLEATGEEPQRDNEELIARLEKLAGGTSEESGNVQTPSSTKSAEQQITSEQSVNLSNTQMANPHSTLEKSSSDVPSSGADTADPFDHVNHRDFDSLMNLTGELVLTRNRLVKLSREVGETKFSAPISRLNRVTTDLQEQVFKTRMQVPQSQAIIPALVVESGGEYFAIPQLNVIELVRLTADLNDKMQQIHDREFFRLRDRLLPLVNLNRLLGFEEAFNAGLREMIIVVVHAGDGQFGLVVSDVFDTEEIVVKTLGSLLKDISIYQGAAVLGDERVILILDVAGIAEQFGGLSSDDIKSEPHVNEETGDDGETISLLLFNSGTGSTMSVPLSLVARLEEFPRESIEQCGDRLVVQYHGDLLPLLPIGGSTQVKDLPETQPVIVFSEGRSSMGLMVQEIQDILEEQLIIRMHSDRPGVLGTAIINGKATDVIDTQHFIMTASPEWFIRNEEKHNYRVLVIDDSLFFRQLVTTSLESEDFSVTSASSAIQAVELIEHGAQFDLIISDIEMPMMDGYEFAQWFKKRPDEKSPPLIALSSLRGAAVESRALESGFDRYLTKFNARQLVRSIEELSLERADSGVKS